MHLAAEVQISFSFFFFFTSEASLTFVDILPVT